MNYEQFFSSAYFHSAYGTPEQLPPFSLPEIALSGRSNVGKSSLLNRLCFQKSLARESSAPGKTITVNYFSLEQAYIVDLPGYGYAKRSRSEQQRFSELCEAYVLHPRPKRLFLQLIDARRGATKDDLTMLSFMHQNNEYFIAVVTKADKLNKTEYAQLQRDITVEMSQFECETIFTSAKSAEGYPLLRERIKEFIENHD